jgi:pantoate--beta-alanine ligase
MIIFKKPAELGRFLEKEKSKHKKIGFVPTMGALHEGHLSLIRTSKSKNDLTVCSIFINPTQFNDPEDFKKYPVTIEKDIQLLEAAGCDLLFLPSVESVYPNGTGKLTHYDLGRLENLLEGKYRPGHFQGVCNVVHQLLDIVMPHQLFLGQKDYQQCMVIHRLLELTGHQKKTELIICPTLREKNGLAMSSRNMRLTADEREKAACIAASLNFIKSNIKPGNQQLLLAEATDFLEKEKLKTDYVAIADASTIQPVTDWDGKQKLVALIAAFMGPVRLIDNMILN